MKTKLIPFILSLVLFSLQPTVAQLNDITVYISPTKGDDRNTGAIKSPFKTIKRAKEFLKSYADKPHNLKIILDDGVHYLPQTLSFEQSDMPSPGHWYSIEARNNGKAEINAGIPLKTKWSRHSGNIYKNKIDDNIDEISSFYNNGTAQIRARYPNFNASITPFNGYDPNAIAPERVRSWKDPTGAVLHALHGAHWGSVHLEVKGKSKDTTLLLDGGLQINRPSAPHKKYRYIENVFEELDTTNEWYYDQKNKLLYYYSNEDLKTLNSTHFTVGLLENSIAIKGSPTDPISNFKVQGIRFQHNIPTFLKTLDPLTRSDWKIYRNGVIYIENAQDILIKDNSFENIGGNGVFVNGYSKNTIIEDNFFDQIGASAISFVGLPSSIYNPRFNYTDTIAPSLISKTIGPKTNEYPIDCIARGNLIRNIGLIEKQCAGVQINTASRIQVLHNTIYNTPRAGINIGDGAFGGHEIAYNDVYNTVLETSDHGAFNSWGRDRFWQSNRTKMNSAVEQDSSLILLDAYQTTSIHHNRFKCEHGWDIDLDDGSSNYNIYNNLCLSGGIKLREGFHRNVHNNIMVNNSLHPHVWFLNSHDTVKRNIVFTSFKEVNIRDYGHQIDSNIFNTYTDLYNNHQKGIDKNGMAQQVKFVSPETGEFTVQNPEILAFGFENFDMTLFGVTNSRLKQRITPVIFPTIKEANADKKAESIVWKGYTIKNLTSLGEQSATGMNAITGVLIIAVPQGPHSTLRVNDVILTYFDSPVKNLSDLIAIDKLHHTKTEKPLRIWRNQQELNLKL